MADVAKWVSAAEKALGWISGTFLADFQAVQQDASEVVLEGSPIPAALARLLRAVVAAMIQSGVTPPDKPDAALTYRKTATELHKLLANGLSDDEKHSFPKAPNSLGTELRRLAPALRNRGIHVAFERQTDQGRGRIVTITAELSRLMAAVGFAA